MTDEWNGLNVYLTDSETILVNHMISVMDGPISEKGGKYTMTLTSSRRAMRKRVNYVGFIWRKSTKFT